MLVHFAGEGSGVAELSWGQREILGAMRRQGTRMPLPVIDPLPPGTTVEGMADWLAYVMGRHQVMRTLIQPRPDGSLCQVLHGEGDIAMDLVDAGDDDPADVAQRMLDWRDRYVEEDYDFATEWPIFLAVILKDAVPTHRLVTVCHIAIDAFGGLALGADLAQREADGPPKPVTAMQPLEQATWQQSPEGQRHCRTVLRHWADVLRQVPARRFPEPVDRGEPRYWRMQYFSPATRLAVQTIRSRTGATSAQVVLTAFLVALADVTGINPAVTRVAVNNRFRRGLADSVSIVNQYGLCVVDVAGIGFDEALSRVIRRLMTTLKNAYYDPPQVFELAERIGRERGEEVDIHCYYNDRRLSADTDATPDSTPTAEQVREALPLTTVSEQPLARSAERLFVAVEAAPDTFYLLLEADTHHLSREAMLACARAVEQTAVRAALDAGQFPCLVTST
jgi:hypothetical protein